MKSEKAKEYLKDITLDRANVEVCLNKNMGRINGSIHQDILNIVKITEDEMRQRAIDAFCAATCRCRIVDRCACHPDYICGDLAKFMKKYDGE